MISDCCVEKGMLHSKVAAELRAWCRTRGWQLHVVDLHWRTPLEAQRDHEFPRLCLSELASTYFLSNFFKLVQIARTDHNILY